MSNNTTTRRLAWFTFDLLRTIAGVAVMIMIAMGADPSGGIVIIGLFISYLEKYLHKKSQRYY